MDEAFRHRGVFNLAPPRVLGPWQSGGEAGSALRIRSGRVHMGRCPLPLRIALCAAIRGAHVSESCLPLVYTGQPGG
jgi:hypothetical protein